MKSGVGRLPTGIFRSRAAKGGNQKGFTAEAQRQQ